MVSAANETCSVPILTLVVGTQRPSRRQDPFRYQGMWKEPTKLAAYLGWPAYLLEAAGEVRECYCGRAVIQGRTYCGSPDCNRERARARKRVSRASRRAMSV